MIQKLYELYDWAARQEQAAEAAKNAYKNPKPKQQEVEYVEEAVLLDEEETTFGAPVGRKN